MTKKKIMLGLAMAAINFLPTDMANAQTQDGPAESDTISILGYNESLMLLPAEEFIRRIKSDGPQTNIDSIYKLPLPELHKLAVAARKRPLRIEVRDVVINGFESLQTAEEYSAFFDSNLNMILICYYIVNPGDYLDISQNLDMLNPRNDEIRSQRYKKAKKYFSDVNNRVSYRFFHELGHAERMKGRNLAGLDSLEIYMLSWHDEVASLFIDKFLICKDFNKALLAALTHMDAVQEKYRAQVLNNADTDIRLAEAQSQVLKNKDFPNYLDLLRKYYSLEVNGKQICVLDSIRPETLGLLNKKLGEWDKKSR